MSTQGLGRLRRETRELYDGLPPEEVAKDYVNTGGKEREACEVYLSKQSEKRASEIREHIKNIRSRRDS